MRMHPDFDSTRSTADVGMLFALCSEYFVSRKRHRYLLRLEIKSLNRVLNEAVSTRMPDGPAPALGVELYFEQSVAHYQLASHSWVPSSPDWFAELGRRSTPTPLASGHTILSSPYSCRRVFPRAMWCPVLSRMSTQTNPLLLL